MSDAPETIYMFASDLKPKGKFITCGDTKYRRDDLPPTPAQIMADPRVYALVNALEVADMLLRDAADYWDELCCDEARAPYTAASKKARAAIAQLKETKP
jgi:hypothetical protein